MTNQINLALGAAAKAWIEKTDEWGDVALETALLREHMMCADAAITSVEPYDDNTAVMVRLDDQDQALIIYVDGRIMTAA
jgi:hypothetical protein